MTQTPITTTSIAYETFKERLYGIGYNLRAFCLAVSIAPNTVTKWKTSGVSYRYIALLEYLETLYVLNEKHGKTTHKSSRFGRQKVSA